jgi:hypothetical protein
MTLEQLSHADHEVRLAQAMAEILKQHGRCWGNASDYDMAYSAVMAAIARISDKLGRHEDQ